MSTNRAAPVPAPATGLQTPIQPMPLQPPLARSRNSDRSHTSERAAYENGAKAHRSGRGSEHNPHPEDSERSKDWEHGYLDSQKIRGNDKPPH